MQQENLGVKFLSPALEEIENILWQHQGQANYPLVFTDEGFRASIKIFMDVMLSNTWRLQEEETMDIQDRMNMAQKLGEDLRALIKTYTNIDTHKLYEN